MLLTRKYEELTRWENRWIACAAENAYFSKDTGTKCGAVIIDPSGKRRIAEGFNGFPQKIKDNIKQLTDRTFKLSTTIHAEMNAILFAKCDLSFHHMYTTSPPCERCATHIIQTGITRVIWIAPSKDYWDRWEQSCMFAQLLMEDANIEMMEVT